MEKRPGPNGGILVLRCKDLRVISLEIPGLEEFNSIGNTIDILSNIGECQSSKPRKILIISFTEHEFLHFFLQKTQDFIIHSSIVQCIPS